MRRTQASPSVYGAARQLRNSATRAERYLWRCLSDRRVGGQQFRRQYAMGSIVFDFYCPTLRLAIEVDGGIHDDPAQKERDLGKEAYAASQGIYLMRFRNEEVLQGGAWVVYQIERWILEKRSE